jgi:NADPH2:quinone reductase
MVVHATTRSVSTAEPGAVRDHSLERIVAQERTPQAAHLHSADGVRLPLSQQRLPDSWRLTHGVRSLRQELAAAFLNRPFDMIRWMKAVRVSRTGGPEVLEYIDVDRPDPKEGQVLMRVEAVGVNFVDAYNRSGLYKQPLPFTSGSEAAGVVERVGEGVTGFKAGDRVAFARQPGAYAEYVVVPAAAVVPLPDGVDARTAAAAMLQGMTAHYLATSVHPIREGEIVLVHAAAGGVGALLVQLAKRAGARVFGTASTGHLDVAREAGCDVVIDYTKEDFEPIVRNGTSGYGCDAVYDSVGKTTFEKSVDCVAVRGTLALFGQSSGPVAAIDPGRLAKNAIFFTRPGLHHYIHSREELLERATSVLTWVRAGRLKLRIDRELPLSQAAEAHRLLEARQTSGKLILIP